MTNEMAIKILKYMQDHEKDGTIIFGNKDDNVSALMGGINAIKFINHIQNHFKEEHSNWEVRCKICNKTIREVCDE